VDFFSKREEGEARPSRTARRPSVTEVDDHLLVGEYPGVEDIAWLKESFGVTAIHNLQDDYDLRHHGLDIAALRAACAERRVKLVRTPISDGSADHMAERLAVALADLHELIGAGERVYLHCNGGLNRAPTLAIAYMRAHGGMSLNEAAAHLKRRRACGPFMTVLEDYFGPRDLKPEPKPERRSERKSEQ
jgi:protein-tyrosine phosphatase